MTHDFVPLPDFQTYPEVEMEERAERFYDNIRRRRSVRSFSGRPVPEKVIRSAIRSAGTAPNGANLQPWHFVSVSNRSIKSQIRAAAEQEEREFYHRRATKEWLDRLKPLGTNELKPFLEEAPCLIAIFSKTHEVNADGEKSKTYYSTESTGIATGILITALHDAGLATLTHTPSPMGFLNQILHRPINERPFLLLVVGFPHDDVTVPKITKKPLDQIATFL